MKQLKKTTWIIPPLIWLIVIWTASSIPAQKMSPVNILGADKLLHLGQYLILSLLVNHSLTTLGARRSIVPWVYLLLLASAGLDEWHQCLIPERSVTIWDFIANGIGLGIGFGFYWFKHDRSQKPVS